MSWHRKKPYVEQDCEIIFDSVADKKRKRGNQPQSASNSSEVTVESMAKQIEDENLRRVAELLTLNSSNKAIRISWFESDPLRWLFHSIPEVLPKSKPSGIPKYLPFEFCANFEAQLEEGEDFLYVGLKTLQTLIIRENAMPPQDLTRDLIHKVMLKSSKKHICSEALTSLRLMISRFDCDGAAMRQWWAECLAPTPLSSDGSVGTKKSRKPVSTAATEVEQFEQKITEISSFLEQLIRKIYVGGDSEEKATAGEVCYVNLVISLMSEDFCLHILRVAADSTPISVYNVPLAVRILFPNGSKGATRDNQLVTKFVGPVCNLLLEKEESMRLIAQKLIGLAAESVRSLDISNQKTAVFSLLPSKEKNRCDVTSMKDLSSCCSHRMTRFVRDFCDAVMTGNRMSLVDTGSVIVSLPLKWLKLAGLAYMSAAYPGDQRTHDILYYNCSLSGVNPEPFVNALKSQGIIG